MERIILGTMNINYKYSSCLDPATENQEIVSGFLEASCSPILDTASYYDEAALGEILRRLPSRPYKIATKANPWLDNDFTTGLLGQLSPANLERQLENSLVKLGRDKADIFFLHCPDYETPIEKTLAAMQDLWRREKLDEWGLSNFSKDQLVEVLDVCSAHDYVQPRYYQGMYNLICRKVEEIFPLLTEHEMEFWAYNPLAGGLLTGKYRADDERKSASRFCNNQIYQDIFWKKDILDAHNSFLTETGIEDPTRFAFQWLDQLSKLRETDKIVLGVSTRKQLDQNLFYFSSSSSESICGWRNEADELYARIADISPNYFY